MQSENRFFDDLSRIINGAAGTIAGMGREVESNARERAREWVGGLDFVSREEFEAVKALAAKAREDVERLEARLAALEGGAPAPAADAAAKPRATRKPKAATKPAE